MFTHCWFSLAHSWCTAATVRRHWSRESCNWVCSVPNRCERTATLVASPSALKTLTWAKKRSSGTSWWQSPTSRISSTWGSLQIANQTPYEFHTPYPCLSDINQGPLPASNTLFVLKKKRDIFCTFCHLRTKMAYHEAEFILLYKYIYRLTCILKQACFTLYFSIKFNRKHC